MARSRKGSKSRSKGKNKPKEEESKEEIWDVVYVYRKKDAKRDCRSDGCTRRAVTTWATNLEPDDKWDMCEECQIKDFGGWPEGVEAPESDDEGEGGPFNHDQEPTENQEQEQEQQQQPTENHEQDYDASKSDEPQDVDMAKDKHPQVAVAPAHPEEEPSKTTDLDLKEGGEAPATTTHEDDKTHDADHDPLMVEALEAIHEPESNIENKDDRHQSNDSASKEGADVQEQEQKESEAAESSADDAEKTQGESKQERDTDVAQDKPTETNSTEKRASVGTIYANANTPDSDDQEPASEKGGEDKAASEDQEPDLIEEPADDQKDAEEPDDVSDLKDIKDPRDVADAEKLQDKSGEGEQAGEEDEEEEQWDLKKVITCDDLKKEGTIKCSTDECPLSACSVWISNLAPTTKWYTCIDCQDEDFDGWPPLDEMPIKTMTYEHQQLMITKCSRLKKPKMPPVPVPTKPSVQTQKGAPNAVTPPPKQIKPSAGALAMHKKWQDTAESMGGKDARIVVSKPAAKKLIFDFLFDAFAPMNVNQIYKGLKAVVPSPVLSSCLKDMAFDKIDLLNQFVDSDDEDKPVAKSKKKEETDPFAASLCFKSGKSQNTNLYYVDHTKVKGMDRDERTQLASDLATVTAERDALLAIVKSTTTAAIQLASEPTNEDLSTKIEKLQGKVVQLREELGNARALKVNEKHKQQTKRKIETMSSHWRRRKRMCMDFLNCIEENTDGTVSVKKCFSGDGQIVLESDESAVKAAVEHREMTRLRATAGSSKKRGRGLGVSPKPNKKSNTQSLADPDFVGVLLEQQKTIKRIYADSDN